MLGPACWVFFWHRSFCALADFAVDAAAASLELL